MGRELLTTINRTETAGPERTVSRAKRLFTDASRLYSASVEAQGAYIALKIREGGIGESAIDLGRALYSDKEVIKSLAETANTMHQAKNKAVEIITPRRVAGIVANDFATAESMQILSSEDLQGILDSFSALHPPQSSEPFDEPRFMLRTLGLLDSKYDQPGSVLDIQTRIHILAVSIKTKS